MVKLFGKLARWKAKRGFREFLADCRAPEKRQAELWNEIFPMLMKAPFWDQRIPSGNLSDFPLTDYEDYRAMIDQAFSDISCKISPLSGQKIIYWSESSGTTAKRKIFPLTKHYRARFQSTTPPYLHGLFERYPKLLSEPVLYFAGMNPQESSASGIDVGFISNFNYRSIPRTLQSAYAFPKEVLKEWSIFEKWAPAYALATDLSAVIAITPSVISRFMDIIHTRRKFLLNVLRGKLTTPYGFPEIRISKRSLERVERAFHERATMETLWPSLQFIGCWKSGASALQLPELRRVAGESIPVHDATYSATEGWVNVPLDGFVGGPIHPGSHVFEFLEEGKDARPRNLQKLWELEAGKNYEIFVTNSMGLVRYRLYDLVQCTGYFHRSPVIHFVQKSLNEISLGMIRVSERQLTEAVQKTELEGRWFFAPSSRGDQLLLCSDTPRAAEQVSFIDQEIINSNRYYARDRSREILKPLTYSFLPAEHPVWKRETHAQAKPVVMRRDPL